jgi:hypothetical protein
MSNLEGADDIGMMARGGFVSTVVAFHFPIVKEILGNGEGVMNCGLRPVFD